MEVICKGYKCCSEKNDCKHSKPHNLKKGCEKTEHNSKNCYCSNVFLRKDKLDKLKKL